MSRILVTGATGFVGAHLVAQLIAEGHEVVAVGRKAPAAYSGRAFIEADLLNAGARRDVVAAANAKHLVHLAWIAEPGIYWHSELNLDWVTASLDLIKQFTQAGGTRVIAIGTCAEYEWGWPRFDEQTTPCRPASFYGTAKDATRRVLEKFAAECGLSLAWARLFFLYGPGERAGRLVSDAIVALREGRPFPTSEGRQRRDFMHVSDAAAALAALLKGPVTGAIDIATGKAVAVREILEELALILGHRDCLRFGERSLSLSDPHIIEGTGERLATEVGFKPRFTLSAGLADTVARSYSDAGC